MNCGACDRKLRKGSMRRSLVLTSDGAIRSALVCSRCALRAVAFVVPPPTTVPPICASCKRGLAKVCEECARRLASNVRELAASNVALAAKRGGAS